MARNGKARFASALVALACALTLAGCKVPFINVEVPLPDLPNIDVSLPDISKLPIPRFTLPIGVRTSVDEARYTVLSHKASQLSDGALVAPGYLTVGVKTYTSSAPLCLVDDSAKLYGLDVDIAAAIASDLGLRVHYVPVTDASSLGVDCDVIMNGRSNNPSEIAIAGTYVETATSFFYKGEPTVSTATDLNGKRIGVQAGSVSEAALEETSLKTSQLSYANLNEAFEGLRLGEVDYVLCETYPGAYLASLQPNASFAGSLEAPVTAGIAVRASNVELVSAVQGAFDTIAANGVLQQIRTRWVGNLPTLTIDSQIQGI